MRKKDSATMRFPATKVTIWWQRINIATFKSISKIKSAPHPQRRTGSLSFKIFKKKWTGIMYLDYVYVYDSLANYANMGRMQSRSPWIISSFSRVDTTGLFSLQSKIYRTEFDLIICILRNIMSNWVYFASLTINFIVFYLRSWTPIRILSRISIKSTMEKKPEWNISNWTWLLLSE